MFISFGRYWTYTYRIASTVPTEDEVPRMAYRDGALQ